MSLNRTVKQLEFGPTVNKSVRATKPVGPNSGPGEILVKVCAARIAPCASSISILPMAVSPTAPDALAAEEKFSWYCDCGMTLIDCHSFDPAILAPPKSAHRLPSTPIGSVPTWPSEKTPA